MDSLVVITGPTAVGKTELCLSLAEHYNIPIINADSRQIYRGMQIGTASPTADQLSRARHYFVGSLALSDYYNASLYEQDVIRLCADLHHQSPTTHHPLAILTGGSMMYIDAVCNGIDDIPTIREDIREMVKRRLETEGLEALVEELRILDPEHYNIVDKKNTRRVVHAIEICLQTGQTYTSFRKSEKKPRPFNVIKIGLNRPREELYNRINLRVDQMMADGLLDEARSLYPLRHLNALNTVGYKEMFDYLDAESSLTDSIASTDANVHADSNARAQCLAEAVERIKGNTRRYARKQLTWFKRDDSMTWFHPDDIEAIKAHINKNVRFLS